MTWTALAIAIGVALIVLGLLSRVFIDLVKHTFPKWFEPPRDFDDDDDRWHWGIK